MGNINDLSVKYIICIILNDMHVKTPNLKPLRHWSIASPRQFQDTQTSSSPFSLLVLIPSAPSHKRDCSRSLHSKTHTTLPPSSRLSRWTSPITHKSTASVPCYRELSIPVRSHSKKPQLPRRRSPLLPITRAPKAPHSVDSSPQTKLLVLQPTELKPPPFCKNFGIFCNLSH